MTSLAGFYRRRSICLLQQQQQQHLHHSQQQSRASAVVPAQHPPPPPLLPPTTLRTPLTRSQISRPCRRCPHPRRFCPRRRIVTMRSPLSWGQSGWIPFPVGWVGRPGSVLNWTWRLGEKNIMANNIKKQGWWIRIVLIRISHFSSSSQQKFSNQKIQIHAGI